MYRRRLVSRALCTRAFEVTTNLSSAAAPHVGSYAQVLHSFPLTAVTDFAALSGDNNPIHLNSDFASKSIFGGIVVHGILVSSLFSTLFGRTLQGSIYLKQTMTFKKPVYVDTEVLARVEVLKLVNSKKGVILECYTRIYCGHEVLESEMAVDGVASVLLPLDKNKI